MYSKNEIQSVCCTKTTSHVVHRFTSLRKGHKFCSTVAAHQSRTFYTLLEVNSRVLPPTSHAKFTIQQSSQYNNQSTAVHDVFTVIHWQWAYHKSP